jgi:molybdopterin converting factor subunit 1
MSSYKGLHADRGNMRIRVLFFATLRDYVGTKTIEMEIPAQMTVAGLKSDLMGRFPNMLPALNSIMTAINQEYADDEQVIPLDAEIALFPPVSGG